MKGSANKAGQAENGGQLAAVFFLVICGGKT
jgi:hypothetical protein